MRGRAILCMVAVAILADGGVRPDAVAQGGGEFQIVVNPENPMTEVDRDLLRDAYLKKATEWPRGAAIRPIDLTPRYTVRERFTRDIVRKTSAQLKSYWSQQIFSGKGVPPPEADSVDAVISYVLANKGGVGYLPATIEVRGAKVVKVK